MEGNAFHPFAVAAKRWGRSFHSMLIAGPEWELPVTGQLHKGFNIDASIHYMIPGSRNLLGIEVNNEWQNGTVLSTLRPQIRLTLSQTVKVGFVASIPLTRATASSGFFIRLIYEPKRNR